MIHTVHKMATPIRYIENSGKWVTLNQYSFRDEDGDCIIIVHGENRRDAMIKHLNSDTNEMGIKYKKYKL